MTGLLFRLIMFTGWNKN